jgi:hypothetical protein
MPEGLTDREQAITDLVSQAMGGRLLDARIVDVHKLEGGQAATLRLTVDEAASADLDRARVGQSQESPEVLAGILIADLKRQIQR